jgi:hypothetical protein
VIDDSSSEYNNDIAGIGRDDGSSLNQKISRSVNNDAVITMSLQNDFTSANNDPSRSEELDDLTFLSWGNNNDALTFTGTNTPNNVDYILDRTWQIQETGDAINSTTGLYLEVDFTGITLPA